MKQSKASTAKSRVYSSIARAANAKITVGLASMNESGDALLDLSLEAESGVLEPIAAFAE